MDKVKLIPLDKEIKYIAGCDVSLNMFQKDIYAGIVVFTYPQLIFVEKSLVKSGTDFPYIPGLLSFREIPALMECFKKLKIKPDLIMVDGQGIAHPRRLGIASHLGVLIDTPTIGCAKSVLVGSYDEPANTIGAHSDLCDKMTNERIGAVLRTKENVKPMIISPGHLVTHDESVELVMKCVRKHRLPEPTRLAHLAVNEFRIADREKIK